MAMRNSMALCAVVLFAAPALAGELPKEGKVSATYNAVGSWKPITAGKNLAAWIWDETGFSNGETGTLFDHLTWQCMGVGALANSEMTNKGNCVATDPSGDQIFIDVVGDPNAVDAKAISGKATLIDGTGKYAGISGGYVYVLHGPEFKLAAEHTYVQYGNGEGNYKFK
jgi:hypothetical protein